MAACEPNVIKGRDIIALLRNDAETEWLLIGGVTTISMEYANPTEVITSQSTQGGFAESRKTGYSTFTASVDGIHDTRQGLHAESGYNFMPNGKLADIADTDEACGKFMFYNVVTNGFLEGCLIIANYSKNREQEGIVKYSMSLESREGVTRTGDL